MRLVSFVILTTGVRVFGAKALPNRCTPGTIVDDGNMLRLPTFLIVIHSDLSGLLVLVTVAIMVVSLSVGELTPFSVKPIQFVTG